MEEPSYPTQANAKEWAFDVMEPDGLSLTSITEKIRNKEIGNIIVMAGAGLSVSAGIPDFRTPGSGLFHKLEEYDIPYPEAIFDIKYFHKNPAPFYRLCHELWPTEEGEDEEEGYHPTFGHYFIAKMQEEGLLKRMYTQNIDGLERVAGIDEERLVEAHGSTFNDFKCLTCHRQFKSSSIRPMLQARETLRCYMINEDGPSTFTDKSTDQRLCEGLIKPSIVFYGESLPQRFFECSRVDFRDADLLLIFGTSLKVTPFCNLVTLCSPRTPRVLINRELVGENLLDWMDKDNDRDLVALGDLDDVLKELAESLGWLNDIERRMHRKVTKPSQETVRSERDVLPVASDSPDISSTTSPEEEHPEVLRTEEATPPIPVPVTTETKEDLNDEAKVTNPADTFSGLSAPGPLEELLSTYEDHLTSLEQYERSVDFDALNEEELDQILDRQTALMTELERIENEVSRYQEMLSQYSEATKDGD